MKKLLVYFVLSFCLLSTVALAEMTVWEAYGKGLLSIYTSNYGISFTVVNSALENIVVNDYIMLISPNVADPTTETTQDGFLIPSTLEPGENVFYYGSFTVDNGYYNPYLGEEPWWCTEYYQYVKSGIPVKLGGQLVNERIIEIINDPNKTLDQWDYDSISTIRNYKVWEYLEGHPSLVIGKLPLYKEIKEDETIHITIWVTNIGRVDSTNARIFDEVPLHYKAFDFSQKPFKKEGRTLVWKIDVPGFDNDYDENKINSMNYKSIKIEYNIKIKDTGRVELPQAKVKWNDGISSTESYSASPVIYI